MPDGFTRLRRRGAVGTAAVMLAVSMTATPLLTSAGSSSPTRAWHVPVPAQAVLTDLTFESTGARLAGTLAKPVGRCNVPAIIVTHAANAPARTAGLYRHLVESLPALGYAVFVYDRRGTGASGGDSENANFDLLAADAIAAQRMVSHEQGINPRQIGFWGLSQGGWLAILAASRSKESAFAIAVSGPATTPAEQMNFAVANVLTLDRVSQSEVQKAVEARQEIDNYLRGTVRQTQAQQALDAIRDKPWFEHAFLAPQLPNALSRWRGEMDYNPLTALNQLSIPVLIVYGAKDPWVPVAASVARLKATLESHPNTQLIIIPDADHAMVSPARDTMAYDSTTSLSEAPTSPAYFIELGHWLALNVGARSPGASCR